MRLNVADASLQLSRSGWAVNGSWHAATHFSQTDGSMLHSYCGHQGILSTLSCLVLIVGGTGCGAPPQTVENGGTNDSSSNSASDSESPTQPPPKPKQLMDLPPTAYPSMEDGIADMMAAAQAKDGEKAMAIGKWIGRNYTPEAIQPLEKVATDESSPVESRIAACQALRYVGPAAGDSLILAANSESTLVATNAVKSLVAMRPVIPHLVDQLTTWIDHSNLHVQQAAIRSLAHIGPQAEACAPKLLAILNNSEANETLRDDAKKALKAVNPRRTFQD